jgi:hypothetical protein
MDPSRKTVVVLGSGWGATSFLKVNFSSFFCNDWLIHFSQSLNTDAYNVVVISP